MKLEMMRGCLLMSSQSQRVSCWTFGRRQAPGRQTRLVGVPFLWGSMSAIEEVEFSSF